MSPEDRAKFSQAGNAAKKNKMNKTLADFIESVDPKTEPSERILEACIKYMSTFNDRASVRLLMDLIDTQVAVKNNNKKTKMLEETYVNLTAQIEEIKKRNNSLPDYSSV